MAGGNGAGNTPDKITSPWGIFVDDNNTMFIVDRGNHRVQRWAFGKRRTRYRIFDKGIWIEFEGAVTATTVAGSTSDPGPWSYQFSNPTAITFDQLGFMYILDFGNDRVQKWWPGASFGTTVVATDLANPLGLRFDRLGGMVIADTNYHRILQFGLTCRKFSFESPIYYESAELIHFLSAPTTTTTVAPPSKC